MSIHDQLTNVLANLKREHSHDHSLRIVISPKGTITPMAARIDYKRIKTELAADTTDSVVLVDRTHVMLVDDLGHKIGKPVNPLATALYWERCGCQNDHVIRGSVYVCPDEDFA